uniref:Uncharacterized protein n=1 Tax=Zosterops lateralis melanops TaxID=1220523 RepID=A0A8D2PJ21_ZOSLA
QATGRDGTHGTDGEGSRAGERPLRTRPTHQPAAEDVEVIHGEDGARVGREHLDAPRDLRLAWRGDAEVSEWGCEGQPPQPSPRTAGRGAEGQRVFLDDAQHGLVGAPGVELSPQLSKPWDNHPPLSTTSEKELTGSQRVPG